MYIKKIVIKLPLYTCCLSNYTRKQNQTWVWLCGENFMFHHMNSFMIPTFDIHNFLIDFPNSTCHIPMERSYFIVSFEINNLSKKKKKHGKILPHKVVVLTTFTENFKFLYLIKYYTIWPKNCWYVHNIICITFVKKLLWCVAFLRYCGCIALNNLMCWVVEIGQYMVRTN